MVFLPLIWACSPVSFKMTERREQEFNDGLPKILINNDAPYTQFLQVDLALSSKDAVMMYITNDSKCETGGQWEIYSNKKEWNLSSESANKEAKVYVLYKDRSDNLTECIDDSILHDNIAPEIEWKLTPEFLTAQSKALFGFLGKDLGSGLGRYECAKDNQNFSTCITPFNGTFSEGVQNFFVRAIDRAGNYSQAIKHNWKIDLTPPLIDIISAPPIFVKEIKAEFQFYGSDENGIDFYECRIESLPSFSSCQSPMIYEVSANVHHTFQVRAVDRAGHRSQIRESRWGVDQKGPQIEFLRIPQNMKTHSSSQISYQVSDEMSGIDKVNCSFDLLNFSCLPQETRDLTNLLPGVHQYLIKASDKLGNYNEQVATWNVLPGYAPAQKTVLVKAPPPVDLLFVDDNSDSMKQEQKNMAERFKDFIQSLQGLDWQLGIVTTDVEFTGDDANSFQDGHLLAFEKDRYILDSKLELERADKLFSDTIQWKGEAGHWAERGIFASYRAMERTSTDLENSKLFRKDSHLAVILISDEDETGKEYKDKPDNWISYVKSKWGAQKSFDFHSIIVRPDDTVCKNRKEHKYGYAYYDLSIKTNGIVGDVCASDYTSQLKDIADKIQDKVNYIILDCDPVDIDYKGGPDIELVLDPSMQVEYKIEGRKILFKKPLPIGKHSIKYYCLL